MNFPSINERKAEGLKPDGTPYRVLSLTIPCLLRSKSVRSLLPKVFDVVGTANDGQEGLDKYKELYPNVDLVTMDITMPKMDGVTSLEKIIEFDKNARVVMISALGKQDLVKKSLLLGAKNYIVKPLDRNKVLERVLLSLNNRECMVGSPRCRADLLGG
jgi:two-component system chemotaxis response regulator CheY